MNANEDPVALAERLKRKLAHLARYERRYARHRPPVARPNREARRAALQREPEVVARPRLLAHVVVPKGRYPFANLVALFKLKLPGKPISKPKRVYESILDAKGRTLLREVRNIDRRPLKEIRRTRRDQTV